MPVPLDFMISEPEIRQLLIDSCHSSADAERRLLRELELEEFVGLLVHIAIDADDYQGDAPMQAAYFLSKAAPSHLQPYETVLISLLESTNGYAGSIALALGRMKSSEAKPIINQCLVEGWWPEHLYREALSAYAGT